jgi:hypothetical protein
MICIFCGENKVNTKERTKNGRNIIFCPDCKGKYVVDDIADDKGIKWLIKFPKGNINPIISMVLMLLIIPIGLPFTLGNIRPIENDFIRKIFQIIGIVYANCIVVPMIIHSFQCIYNYMTKGYILTILRLITKDDPLFYRISQIVGSLIVGIITLVIMIYMDFTFLKYIFKL